MEKLFEQIQVVEPFMWENEVSPLLENWYAIVNNEGIIAYFGNETDAHRFRLDYINRILNP